MLAKEFQKELEERYEARILFIAPYMAQNSDGQVEQYYQVDMANDEESFYLNVDEFGAVCGQEKHDVRRFDEA